MIISNNPTSILSRLKHETRELHHRLEARVDILNPALKLERYQALLERFYGFYLPVESQLATLKGFESINLDPAPRWKVSLIVKDLVDLGISFQSLVELPRCTDLPEFTNVSEALGCIYVLEGATLGGQIISRHLKNEPGFGAKSNFNFYNSYGVMVGPMWKAFCQGLDGFVKRMQVDDPAFPVETAIIEVANQTFQKLDGWLAQLDI